MAQARQLAIVPRSAGNERGRQRKLIKIPHSQASPSTPGLPAAGYTLRAEDTPWAGQYG